MRSTQGRIGDRAALGEADPARPNRPVVPGVTGSPNVLVNNRPALRVGDLGGFVNSARGFTEVRWVAKDGARCVLINNRNAHRALDPEDHRGEPGALVEGSRNVLVGDWERGHGPHERTWIGISLHDEDGSPIAGTRYMLRLPDGGARAGFLDKKGEAVANYVPSGVCKVRFPDLIDSAWRRA
ncbi:MAG: hypothetical protein HUU21_12460 [Polyangiaceae bacterium]|nr:hypothetical protein [Polyangiaceae bacterium]